VEDACYKVHKTFRIRWFGYDPAAGGSFMAQRLRRRGVPMRELSFSSPTNLKNMATSLVQCMTSRTLEGFDDEDGRLRRDFGKFNILEKPSYYRLEAVSDEFGHADVGTALVICLFVTSVIDVAPRSAARLRRTATIQFRRAPIPARRASSFCSPRLCPFCSGDTRVATNPRTPR